MDYDKLSQAITEKTKVIIPVDLGGVICDYDKIFAAIENYKHLFNPANDIQKAFGRIVVMAMPPMPSEHSGMAGCAERLQILPPFHFTL